ncbi:MAG: hypothetical protein L3J66_02770 [Bacteroidales bacterium]|nr:hypothetical protein [Bacteroidales bacterium]
MKNPRQIILSLFAVFALISCTNTEDIHSLGAKLVQHKYFPHLSSASGVEFSEGDIYLIGDDSPFLFQLDESWNIVGKQKIAGIDTLVNGRIPKRLKTDLESVALLEEAGLKQLLLLPSGSKEITRDTAFLIFLKSDATLFKKNMRPVFNTIKQQAGLEMENSINIEGLAFSKNKAYLLHRGNVSKNFIVEMDRTELLAFIKSERGTVPELKIYPFALPYSDGVAAGFSGLCVLPAHQGLLFTASLENTKNEIDDGTVLGSYLGFIPFSKMAEGKFVAELIRINGEMLAKKLEGITLKSVKGKNIVVLAVSDNDDGSSDLYEIALKINPE